MVMPLRAAIHEARRAVPLQEGAVNVEVLRYKKGPKKGATAVKVKVSGTIGKTPFRGESLEIYTHIAPRTGDEWLKKEVSTALRGRIFKQKGGDWGYGRGSEVPTPVLRKIEAEALKKIKSSISEAVELDEAKGKSARAEFVRKTMEKYGPTMPGIDSDEYPKIRGMEGPFRMGKSHGKLRGRVVYYDPREGKYYDSKSDMYVSEGSEMNIDEARAAAAVDLTEDKPGSTKYVVSGLGNAVLKFGSAKELIKAMGQKGISQSGTSGTKGPARAELHNQPKFSGLLGPMYDGPGKIRYETAKRYRELSQ